MKIGPYDFDIIEAVDRVLESMTVEKPKTWEWFWQLCTGKPAPKEKDAFAHLKWKCEYRQRLKKAVNAELEVRRSLVRIDCQRLANNGHTGNYVFLTRETTPQNRILYHEKREVDRRRLARGDYDALLRAPDLPRAARRLLQRIVADDQARDTMHAGQIARNKALPMAQRIALLEQLEKDGEPE